MFAWTQTHLELYEKYQANGLWKHVWKHLTHEHKASIPLPASAADPVIDSFRDSHRAFHEQEESYLKDCAVQGKG